MRRLMEKYKEVILYIFFGAITTLVNLVVFKLCNLLLGNAWYLVSNAVAWAAAVATAFVTNKSWVFESRSWSPSVLRRELPAFVGVRVFSFLIEEAGLFLMIDLLHCDRWSVTLLSVVIGGHMICKFFLQIVVLMLNYVFSKLVIFKKAE